MSLKTFFSKIKHNYIWNNRFVFWGMLFNFVLNIAYFGLILFVTKGRANDVAPLHYNIYFGIDNFGSPKEFFVFPQVSSIIFLINSFLCYYYYKYSRVLSYFLLVTSIFASLFMIFSYILIILFIEL